MAHLAAEDKALDKGLLHGAARYARLYWKLFKFCVIQAVTYRVNFFIELAVELGYLFAFFLLLKVIYANVGQIAGWSEPEMMLIYGLGTFTAEIFLSVSWVFGIRVIPEKVVNGAIDYALLRPLPSMLSITTFEMYLSGFISGVPALLMAWYGYSQIPTPDFASVVGAGVVMACGYMIFYCVSVVVTSLAFRYGKAATLPRVAFDLVESFRTSPTTVFQGGLRAVFFLILPVVFVGALPVEILTRGLDPLALIGVVVVTGLWFLFTVWFWRLQLSFYGSASS